MTRPTIFLMLLALTLVAAHEPPTPQIAAEKARALKQSRGDIVDHYQADIRDPYQPFKDCNANLTICNGNLSTCDADLSVCETNLSVLKTSWVICDGKLATCEADLSTCDANSADQQATHDELMMRVKECEDRIMPTSPPDCRDHSAEEKVECETCKHILDRAIRRQRNMCEMRLENQRSEIEVIERIVGSESTQAPRLAAQDPSALPPAWQGPPAPRPAAQDSSASPPDWQGPPAPPASAPPAPDYIYHFFIFWLVVLVCFGFRIRHLMVRGKTSASTPMTDEQIREYLSKAAPYWDISNEGQRRGLVLQFHMANLQRSHSPV